jgi:hypothetical protein
VSSVSSGQPSVVAGDDEPLAADRLLTSLAPSRRRTLVAREDGDGLAVRHPAAVRRRDGGRDQPPRAVLTVADLLLRIAQQVLTEEEEDD